MDEGNQARVFELLEAQEMEKAFAYLEGLANNGDAEAQYELGVMCRAGEGCPASAEGAAGWRRQAAAGGNALAQYNLGNLHLLGEGVERDDANALAWTEKAAQQDHPDACFKLGQMLQFGFAGSDRSQECGDWYTRAANSGHGRACLICGCIRYLEAAEAAEPGPYFEAAARQLSRSALAEDLPAKFVLKLILDSMKILPENRAVHCFLDGVSLALRLAPPESLDLRGKLGELDQSEADLVARALVSFFPETFGQ